jgi:hypothetical protein
MKKICCAVALLAFASSAFAARQDVNQINAVTANREGLRSAVNVELEKINDNDVEFEQAIGDLDTDKAEASDLATTDANVALKADKDKAIVEWSSFINGHVFNVDRLVLYGAKVYKCVTQNTKASDNNPAVDSDWEEFFVAGQGSNLAATAGASTVVVTNDNGTGITIPAATSSTAGAMTAADATKLSGVAAGATANSSDATLLARANHTGTQAASTISDFSTAVTGNATVSAALSKLAGIQSGAQVNVKPDWNATPGAANEILNQPDIVATDQDFTVTAEATFEDIILPLFDTAAFDAQNPEPTCSAGAYFIYFTATKARQCVNGTASDIGSGTGSMTFPSANNLGYTTDGATWSAMGLDTDFDDGVSSTDNTVPSAKAVKAAIDAVSVASGVDHRTSDPDDPATGYTWIRTDTGNEALKSATATGILSVDLTYTADDFTPAAFSFSPVVDATPGATVVGGTAEINDLGTGRKTPISIANGSGSTGCAYSVCYNYNETEQNRVWSNYTSTAGKLDVNNSNLGVRVQQVASSSNSTATTCDLTVGSMTRSTSVTTVAGASWLLAEDFNSCTGGLPTGWADQGGDATYSCSGAEWTVTYGTTDDNVYSASFTETGDIYAGFKVTYPTMPSSSSTLLHFRTPYSSRGTVEFWNDGAISANPSGGTSNKSSDGIVSANTAIFVKVHLVKGTGANSTMTVWTSTNGTSWTQRAESTNGTNTEDWARIGFRLENTVSSVKIDNVRVDNADFNM